MDDIVVYNSTMEEHQHHLQLVFKKLRKHQLYVKREKCAFAQQWINFIGHVIEVGRVGMEEKKVKVITDWKIPSSVTEVRSFLGLANYYWRFVEGFSKRASPLTEQLKKGNMWSWTPCCQEAFDNLKNAMIEGQVLGIADVKKPFEVRCVRLRPRGRPTARGIPHCIRESKAECGRRKYAASKKETVHMPLLWATQVIIKTIALARMCGRIWLSVRTEAK